MKETNTPRPMLRSGSGFLPLDSSYLLLVFFLRPNFSSPADRIVDFGLLLLLLCFLLFTQVSIPRRARLYLFLLCGLASSFFLTVLYNLTQGVHYTISDLFEFYRPVYQVVLLLFGLTLFRTYSEKLARMLTFVLAVEALLMLLQLRNFGNIIHSPLAQIWNMEKVSTGSGRAVGTLTNPNDLGLFFNVAFSYLISRSWKTRTHFPWHLLGLQLVTVFLSSSRTGLIVWLVLGLFWITTGWKRFQARDRGIVRWGLLSLGLALLLALPWLLEALRKYQYIYDFVSKSLQGNLLEINSIKLRIAQYLRMFDFISDNFLLGIGPQKDLIRVGDNDYLFSLTQWGLLGFVMKFSFFAAAWTFLSRRATESWFAQALQVNLLCLFLYALTGETFYNFKFLSIFIINLGFLLAQTDGFGRDLRRRDKQ